jgi:hypothetical protein
MREVSSRSVRIAYNKAVGKHKMLPMRGIRFNKPRKMKPQHYLVKTDMVDAGILVKQ